MKRKVLAVLFATALTAGMLSGCGSTDSTSDKADQKEESLEEETSEGQTGVDEETAANAVSEEEAEAAGFSDHEESADDQEASGDAEDTSHETEASADSTEDTDSADGEFSDGSEDAQMAGTTVIDTSQQLIGTHHAAITVKDYGEIDVELDADTAPITVTNFVKLVQDNFYDGLTFHRIIDGFMIQGGDPNGDGTGGAEDTIKGEFSSNGVKNDISHVRGTISMARSTDPDSASSQFFIVQSDSTHLDGDYAAFGHVTSGMDIVDQICKEIRNHKNTPIIMVSAKKDDIDKIRGLGLGADDYMTKPFSPSELVARVKAHMARYDRLVGSNAQKNDIIEIRGIKIDKTARRVWVDGGEKNFFECAQAKTAVSWRGSPCRRSPSRR